MKVGSATWAPVLFEYRPNLSTKKAYLNFVTRPEAVRGCQTKSSIIARAKIFSTAYLSLESFFEIYFSFSRVFRYIKVDLHGKEK